MAITNLTNTTWIFNSSMGSNTTGLGDYNITFVSNESLYNYLYADYEGYVKLTYVNDTEGINYTPNLYGVWDSNAYRTISITGGTDVTNSALITFLELHAVQQVTEVTKQMKTIKFPNNPDKYEIVDAFARAEKQDMLISGTNIKTINGEPILGGGNLIVSSQPLTQVEDLPPTTEEEFDLHRLYQDGDNVSYLVKHAPSELSPVVLTGGESIPSSVNNSSCAQVGDYIYIFPSGYDVTTIYRYDIKEKTFSTLTANSSYSSTTWKSNTCAVIDDKIYIVTDGDGSGSSNSYSAVVWRYNPQSNLLERLLSGGNLSDLSNLSCVSDGTYLYIFGGYRYSNGYFYSSSIIRYDVDNDIDISLTQTLPSSRYSLTCQYYNGKIYLFGGYGGGNSYYQNTIFVYNINTGNIYTSETVLPYYGIYESMLVNDKIYLILSYENNANSSDYREIYLFDPETEEIEKLTTQLPTSRQYACLTSYENRGFIFGGGSSRDYVELDFGEGYHIDTFANLTDLKEEVKVVDTLPSSPTKDDPLFVIYDGVIYVKTENF